MLKLIGLGHPIEKIAIGSHDEEEDDHPQRHIVLVFYCLAHERREIQSYLLV